MNTIARVMELAGERNEKIVFADANHFLAYIQELSDSWYRFM